MQGLIQALCCSVRALRLLQESVQHVIFLRGHAATLLPRALALLSMSCMQGGDSKFRHQQSTGQQCLSFSVAGGHTASNAPDLFRTPKLSGAGTG